VQRYFPRVYLALIVMHLAIEVLIGFLGWEHPAAEPISWLVWPLIVAAGICAGLANWPILKASWVALPFALISFGHGLLAFAFGWMEMPVTPAPVPHSLVFSGFLIASAVLAALGLLFAALSALGARIYLRTRGVRGPAA
jgi:hypothetical protein